MEKSYYVRREVTESTQGAKTSQISLVGQPSEPASGTTLSTEFNQTGTVSVPDPPKALPAFNRKSRNMFKAPCIQRTLEQKLMLRGYPDTQLSNPIQMPSGQWLNQSGVNPIHLYLLI